MENSFVFQSGSEADTAALGAALAQIARPGDCFALFGTLGMGKSVFSRGFIQKLAGQGEEVPSPTFTLVQIYNAKDFMVYHYDLYRLKDVSETYELGMEEALFHGVSLIEWPERMSRFLPPDAFKVEIEPAGSGDGRKITVSNVDEKKYHRLKLFYEGYADK